MRARSEKKLVEVGCDKKWLRWDKKRIFIFREKILR